MANIFKAQQQVNDHPNRNNFDLSKKSNVSLKFGTLYPVYCQPVVPGDSFSIDTAFNLKLMPVVFPVQTKMRAHMHYFYVRNKNLWSNWENWISNLVGQSDHPHPYISLPDIKFKNGSIHDFLGVPTSVLNDKVAFGILEPVKHVDDFERYYLTTLPQYDDEIEFNDTFTSGDYVFTSFDGSDVSAEIKLKDTDFVVRIPTASVLTSGVTSIENKDITFMFNTHEDSDYYFAFSAVDDHTKRTSPMVHGKRYFECHINTSTISDEALASIKQAALDGNFNIMVGIQSSSLGLSAEAGVMYYEFISTGFFEYSSTGLDLYSNALHINALPYRGYESIYYAYYNNNVLNPLKINDQVQYNRYNTELGDGADSTDYHLFQRNYELDFLTSALPSPQQGVAPVVGMTALGDITIEDENGITTAHADIDNDGTITKVVLTSPAASNEHARTAMNIAACGMSINDFRSTNALQRVLETNIRKGYRYMDFIAGHFGKEPEYRELDMPEFIGGFSRDVSVSTVVSNADTLSADSGAALGEYGGYAQVVGGGNHSVRHYCDDYGYIIGILSVVPTPCYSQLLPKHMIAPDNFLDYYFPSMSQLGLQPITYKEVAPIQSYIDSLADPSKSLEDTFGYQRPNYDMVSAVDELHGEFRGSLRDYVINRIFDTRPELGQSFISINPSEINDIFVNQNPDEDTILGEIGFSVHAKRPVPRVVIPNLGR